MDTKALAQRLDEATVKAKPIQQLSLTQQYTLEQAYQIQADGMFKRANRGDKSQGIKLSFTNKEKMKQMGVEEVIFGRLSSRMLVQSNAHISLEKYIRPRVEAEICFLVKKEINKALTMEETKDHIIGIAPAIEIVDSRYQGFKFSLPDLVADNCWSAGVVLGKWHDIKTPIADLKMELVINDEVVQTGRSKAIYGDPWEAAMAATHVCAKYGHVLKTGNYIFAGAGTPAVFIEKDQKIEARVDTMGNVQFTTQ